MSLQKGSPQCNLPIPERDFKSATTTVTGSPSAISLHSISDLFFHSLALSAWKSHGRQSWSLRVNPSSGNLHPVESYLVVPQNIAIPLQHDSRHDVGDAVRILHYDPLHHRLQLRARFNRQAWKDTGIGRALPEQCMLLCLSAIHWREAWKYGERAFRYSQMDMGHAICAMSLACQMLGWRSTLWTGCSDDAMASLIGLDRGQDFECKDITETEYPEAVLVIDTANRGDDALEHFLKTVRTIDRMSAADRSSCVEWYGVGNALSKNRFQWPVIHQVAEECANTTSNTNTTAPNFFKQHSVQRPQSLLSAKEVTSMKKLVRQRRSALGFDGKTGMDCKVLYSMLSKLMPTVERNLWSSFYVTLYPSPRVHLLLFVHRINGISPGIYALVRDEDKIQQIQREWQSSSLIRRNANQTADYMWKKPDSCPLDLPLYQLTEGDVRRLATQVSCDQDIAGDGAFSFGMIAEFDNTMHEYGSAAYKHLHWESGFLCHLVYIESERHGFRTTGMGCYFDDAVHALIDPDVSLQPPRHNALLDSEFQDDPHLVEHMERNSTQILDTLRPKMRWQSMYHCTVGRHIVDERLQHTDPYRTETRTVSHG